MGAILGQTIGGLIFSLLAGQPLIIIMTTAPIALYIKVPQILTQRQKDKKTKCQKDKKTKCQKDKKDFLTNRRPAAHHHYDNRAHSPLHKGS